MTIIFAYECSPPDCFKLRTVVSVSVFHTDVTSLAQEFTNLKDYFQTILTRCNIWVLKGKVPEHYDEYVAFRCTIQNSFKYTVISSS